MDNLNVTTIANDFYGASVPCKHNWEPMIWESHPLADHKKVIQVYCRYCLETKDLK